MMDYYFYSGTYPEDKMSKAEKARLKRDHRKRKKLAEYILQHLPCTEEQCHHHDGLEECDNKACPWRPLREVAVGVYRERTP